jgi:hypothetical protein
MGVAPVFEGLLENEVAVCMIGDHDILIAGAGFDWESASVVRVEFADGIDVDVDFTGWRLHWWVDMRDKRSCCGSRLGRTNILALLG